MNERGFAFKPRTPMQTAAAQRAHEQRTRLDARAKRLPLRDASGPIVVVVGGRGVNRRLSTMLAELVGDAVTEADAPLETVERVGVLAMGRVPRVVLLAPKREADPLAGEMLSRGWTVTDLLRGLRSADRQAQLRHAINVARRVRE